MSFLFSTRGYVIVPWRALHHLLTPRNSRELLEGFEMSLNHLQILTNVGSALKQKPNPGGCNSCYIYIYLLYIYNYLYVIHSVLRWNEILTTKRTDMGIARRLNVRKLFNELQSSGSLGNQHLWHCLDSSHAPAGTIGQSENSKCKWLGWGALECHLRSATSSSSWECLWWNQKKGGDIGSNIDLMPCHT